MNEREIRRVRNKFILASTLSLFFVMLLMGGIIYFFVSMSSANEAMQIIDYIVENDGRLPTPDHDHDKETVQKVPSAVTESTEAETEAETKTEVKNGRSLRESMIRSFSDLFGTGDVIFGYENFTLTTRYFAILYDEDGEFEVIRDNFGMDISEEEAQRYAELAQKRLFDQGSYGGYYYAVKQRPSGGNIVVYLDRSSQLVVSLRVMYVALIAIGFGTLIAFLIMRLVSASIVKNEIEAAERQKQFITNASHELKTPLAVIRANTEMTEIMSGESEWTRSTLRQIGRMDGLIRNLVMITRSQEQEKGEGLTVIDVSKPVRETAESFVPVAASEDKTLQIEVSEDVRMRAEDSQIRQLTSLLTDNAVKYCDDAGRITVQLNTQGKYTVLTVTNTYAEGEKVDFRRFFDRFYRKDDAHTGTAERSGYGIGLSVAESLVRQMLGRIEVNWKNGEIIFVCRFKGA